MGDCMNEEKFSNLEELYQRLLPAIRTKKNEMLREKMYGITEKEIWMFFCRYVWSGKSALTLGVMVDDILNTDNFTIYSHRGGNNGTYNSK